MFFPQILDSFEQLLPLTIPVPPPRLRQAEHETGRIRLLGRLEGGFEFLADAARLEVGFHPAHYNLPANARADTSLPRSPPEAAPRAAPV